MKTETTCRNNFTSGPTVGTGKIPLTLDFPGVTQISRLLEENSSTPKTGKNYPFCCLLLLLAILPVTAQQSEPIKLHPENPHYFLWRSQPTVLITSTEHYGAVLNLDFDFLPYFDELKSHRFNLTRAFSGSYREIEGSFNIRENTLAPKQGRFICPWARSSTPGASDGGNKFELEKWDPAYFERLKKFISEADKRGIVVEYVFFCTMYSEELWLASPMNTRNNVNEIGKLGPYEVYSAKEQRLQEAQEALVRKVVRELKDAPNLYYEICNEPYERGGLTREWNDRIIAVIRETEASFPHRHLIAQGFNREPARVENPNPDVSIFNFHAASATNASENYQHNRALADDETGGKGIHAQHYRREAWEFMLAGGAVFDHLDFSFTVAHPDGTHPLSNEPGGGGPEIRAQLSVLKKFFESFQFIRMKPDSSSVRVVRPGTVRATVLADPSEAYAIYLAGQGAADLELSIPSGDYLAEWVEPKSGKILKREKLSQTSRTRRFSEPLSEDIALRLKKTD